MNKKKADGSPAFYPADLLWFLTGIGYGGQIKSYFARIEIGHRDSRGDIHIVFGKRDLIPSRMSVREIDMNAETIWL